MSSTNFELTISGTILGELYNKLEITNHDTQRQALAKFTLGIVAFPTLFVAGIIEGLARGALALIAKIFSLPLLQDWLLTQKIEALISYGFHSAAINLIAVPIVATVDLLSQLGQIHLINTGGYDLYFSDIRQDFSRALQK